MVDQFLTVKEVAARLQVSERTVNRWLVSGDLRATRFGRAVRISEEELQRFIAQR